jgi:hypothetical protein
MDASLSRGYAAQLIDRMPSDRDFQIAIARGMDEQIFKQFHKICYTKKPDTIPRKMRRASEGRMRIRIPNWERQRATVVLDCITGARNQPAHSYFTPDKIRWHESVLIMHTFFCERQRNTYNMYRLSGPSICRHAIARLLYRNAATPETLRATCHAALSRVREASSLLRQEDNVYDLLLPFADGAIAVHVHGSRASNSDRPLPPSLSIRTYLTEAMLNGEKAERILDLQDFYLSGAGSDTERYKELLMQNRRFHEINKGENVPKTSMVQDEEIPADS